MNNLAIYIHGKNGNIEEAKHYEYIFRDYDVIPFDYHSQFPWEAKEEFANFFDSLSQNYDSIIIIANSIGAFLSMSALFDKKIDKAFFISPIVNMERLILDMMAWENVTEEMLQGKGEIRTSFGEILSWKYLSYVRNNPIIWAIPTYILYGGNDNFTSYPTILEFSKKANATLTIMENGEHFFHTKDQMKFLDSWIELYK